MGRASGERKSRPIEWRMPAALAICATLTAATAVARLTVLPLGPAERDILAQAASLGSGSGTARADGYPLFFPTATYPPGHEPSTVYPVAAGLHVLPPQWALRLPAVLVATINVLLLFGVARRLPDGDAAAMLAAAVLMVSPAHVMASAVAGHALYPVVFVLAAAWCAIGLADRPDWRRALGTGLCLGVGLFTHPAALVLMPLFWLAVCTAVLTGRRPERWRLVQALMIGFAVPIAGGLAWEPAAIDRVARLAEHYRLYDPRLNLVQGLREMTGYYGLSVRSYMFWQHFSPSLLFFAGQAVSFESRVVVGAMLAPVAILLVAGVVRLAGRPHAARPWLALGVIAPALVSAVEPSHVSISRALVMLPFAAVIAAVGYGALRDRSSRALAASVVVLMLVQFVVFLTTCAFDPQCG